MNATITKIVGLLFEDLAQTDEVLAIREEVEQNCQERYRDLRQAGMEEDAAIHAVIESLNGMEEMLAGYPRKEETPVQRPETSGAEEARSWSSADERICEIRMEHMASADVSVVASEDEQVHVECSNPELALMTGVENGVLTIALSEEQPGHIPFSLENSFDLASIGRLFEKIAQRFSNSFQHAEITLAIPAALRPSLNVHTASGNISIACLAFHQLQVGTASGDVELDDVSQHELRISSASGDLTLTNVSAQQMQLSSVSGDVEFTNGSADVIKASSTSGDVTLGQIIVQHLQLSSISGDLEVDGTAPELTFKTVSGDVDVSLSGEVYSISGKATNGDVDIHLPEGTRADVHCSTVSGDIHNRIGSLPGAPVSISLSTVNGDIHID